MGMGTGYAPGENDGFETSRRWVLSRHTLWKSLKKSRLERELGGRGKSRQYGRGGIENRPSADVAANRAVEHGLPRGRAPQDADEPPAVLELAGERMRRDLGRAVEEDEVVRSAALPALGERTGHHRHIIGADGFEVLAGEANPRFLLLKRDHRARQARQQRGRIAARAADIEHMIARLDRGALNQLCQHHRL